MNKLLVTLIASALASVAAAQTAAPSASPKERQKDVQSVTGPSGENSGNAQTTAAEQARNVKASQQVTTLSKAEKAKLAKDATKLNVNPENSSGTAATATMQRQSTTISKATPRPNTDLKSKDGKQQLDRELQTKSTP